jgi:hypothetical protein
MNTEPWVASQNTCTLTPGDGRAQKGMRCGITSGTRMKPGAGGAWLLLYGWGIRGILISRIRSELLKKKLPYVTVPDKIKMVGSCLLLRP